jgi:hypothetical protein
MIVVKLAQVPVDINTRKSFCHYLSTTEVSNINVRAGKFSSEKKRKYHETYLERGFTYSTIDGEQRPQCFICSETLENDSMKPVKLNTHMATKQAEFENMPVEFFERKLKSLCHHKLLIEQHTIVPRKCTESIIRGNILSRQS